MAMLLAVRRFLDRLRRRPSGAGNLTRDHLAGEIGRLGWSVGDFSYGRPRVRHWGEGARLVVGRFCSIADGVEILLGGNHPTDIVTTYPFFAFPDLWPGVPKPDGFPFAKGDIVIGSDVWIGAGATILSGVTIGSGAVIAARAVVAKDVPPYAIVAGNPGRVVRMRFAETTVADLVASRWWDLPPERIRGLIPLLQSRDVAGFLAACKEAGGGTNRPG